MKYFCYAFVFLLLLSCQSIQQQQLESRSFEEYLKENDSELVSYIRQSKERVQKRISESFVHVDSAVAALEKEGDEKCKIEVYGNLQDVLDDIYLEYIRKKTTYPLTTLEKTLYSEVEKSLSNTNNYTEKAIILKAREEAEHRFDLEIKKQNLGLTAQNELKNFVDKYTQGFFIYSEKDPEDFQQYYLDAIAQFKTCFYLLMTEAIKK